MSYMETGIKFHTEPTHNKFVPKIWIADGIRRSIDERVIEPGAQFVSKEDYDKMAYASELAATDMSLNNYRAGKVAGFSSGVGLCGAIAILAGMIMMMGGCATHAPRPAPDPIRKVSSRVASVVDTDKTFMWIKFTDSRKAMPIRIVDDREVSMMVPGTAVMMVKVTDSAGTGLEVRGGNPGEKVLAVMIVH